MYYILVTPQQHYKCGDPIKFKSQIETLSNKKEENWEDVMSYFFHRHFIVYLHHINMMTHSDFVFNGPENFIEYAENMSEVFRDWLGEERYDELVTHAHGVLKEMIELKDEEE